MKKLFLYLLAISFSIAGASAMNLREAYSALSNLPYVSQTLNDTISVPISTSGIYSGTMQVSQAAGLDRSEIFKAGNATFAILRACPIIYVNAEAVSH